MCSKYVFNRWCQKDHTQHLANALDKPLENSNINIVPNAVPKPKHFMSHSSCHRHGHPPVRLLLVQATSLDKSVYLLSRELVVVGFIALVE